MIRLVRSLLLAGAFTGAIVQPSSAWAQQRGEAQPAPVPLRTTTMRPIDQERAAVDAHVAAQPKRKKLMAVTADKAATARDDDRSSPAGRVAPPRITAPRQKPEKR